METPTNTNAARTQSDRWARLGDWHAPPDAGLRRIGTAFVVSLVIMIPLGTMGAGAWYAEWSEEEAVRRNAAEAALAYERIVAAPPMSMLPVDTATRGRDVFVTTCAACHGPDGRGIPTLGKTLVESDYVAGHPDDWMVMFLREGRPNAVPTGMPPKGGREDLTDADLRAVTTYLRGLQDPRRLPELPTMVMTTTPTAAAEAEAALTASGGDEELAGYIASGTKLFAQTCIACHGAGGVGMAGKGKTLINNTFVNGLDDDGLLAFIQKGRDPGDPLNTTGVAMPPKGGNPALSEDDLLDIISYLRTLQPSEAAALSTTE
jgi:disulfide bond formation protein DsbB